MNLASRGKKVVTPVLGRYYPDFEIKCGQGCYVYDTHGKKYLDFAAGIATCSTGHCHPKVVATAGKQTKTLIHTCIGIANYEPYIALAEKMATLVPFKHGQFFFCQSGSEAVEAALKLARYTTKKPGLVALRGAFHGRTLGALSVTTSKMKYQEGYLPLLPEVYITEADLAEIEEIFKKGQTAAVIIEPILGEGGYLVLPNEFVRGLRKLCDKYAVLLIADEVQTGIGRTGKWFALDHIAVAPDIICMAKGLASGFPLGAVAAPAKIMQKWSPGAHGSTFGGNPVSCAAALATINVIQQEKLLQNVRQLGAHLKKELLKLQTKMSLIKEVRGMGLMLGVEFGDAALVKEILQKCLAAGLLLISTGADGTTIRFVPPLTVNKQQIVTALKIFTQVLSAWN